MEDRALSREKVLIKKLNHHSSSFKKKI